MVPGNFFGSLCSITVIAVLALVSTVIEVKTFPHRQLLSNNYNFSHSSFDDTGSFSYRTLENGSKWIVPRFPSNRNDNITFCRNKQTIRIPVRLNAKNITVPCRSTFYGFQNGTNILLYKGSPETNLTLISRKHDEHDGILEFVKGLGFRYDATSDFAENNSNSSVLGRYTCFIANSSGENYVTAEYYRDDDGVNVYSTHCSLSYYVYNRGKFLCQVKGVENETNFQWYFKSVDNKEEFFEPKGKETHSKDGLVVESINYKLPYSNISEVGCRVKRNNSNETFQGLLPIQVRDLKKPMVLDKETVEIYDEPGLNITCSFDVEDSGSTTLTWFRNGHEELKSGYTSWKTPTISTTTLTGLPSVHNSTNYTCVIWNTLGNSSKTFVILPKPVSEVAGVGRKGDDPSQLVYISILTTLATLLLLTLALEWKKRYEVIGNVKSKLRELGMKDKMNLSAIELDENRNNWATIGNGAYGQVWRTKVKLLATGEEVDAVAKSILWFPTLRRKTVKLLFNDFINEITYHGNLVGQNKDYREQYIVQYLGFHAPDVKYFKVYLILDHCYPGQLESFLCKNRDKRFFNDINGNITTYRYEQRLRQEQIRGGPCLGISHLMKWAEQIALAMEYLHSLKIVHRDLAARNILLKGPSNYRSIDEVVAQLADFGLSRSVEHSKNYIINQKLKTKPRNLPFLWYPPESIGFGDDVEYTTKSDVWSFGVLLWEMFSLGKHPDEGYGLTGKIQAGPFREELQTKKLQLKKTDLKKIPNQIWELMQSCWDLNPEVRPNFSEIYENLKAINLSYGLIATQEQEISHENQDQDPSQNLVDSPNQNRNPLEVNLDTNHENVLSNHNRDYSQHGLHPISSNQNQSNIEINSHEVCREINIITSANQQDTFRTHSLTSDSDNVQPIENVVPVNLSENTITVLRKNDYVP